MKYWLFLWQERVSHRTGLHTPPHNEVWKGEHPALLVIPQERVLVNFWEISKEVYDKLEEHIG